MGDQGPRLVDGSFLCVEPKDHTTCPQGGSCMHRFQAFLVNEQAAAEQSFLGRKETLAQMPQGRIIAEASRASSSKSRFH
jgi:hypothetical protein